MLLLNTSGTIPVGVINIICTFYVHITLNVHFIQRVNGECMEKYIDNVYMYVLEDQRNKTF